MSIETLTLEIEKALTTLNQTPLRSEFSSVPQRTYSSLIEIDSVESGYLIYLHNDSLRMSSSDYNDCELESGLFKTIKKLLEQQNPDITVVEPEMCEKGHWGFVISLHSESDRYNKIQSLQDDLNNARNELTDFNHSVLTKIKNSSKNKKTCSHCDGNIPISFLRTHKCPICNHELYTAAELTKATKLSKKVSSIFHEREALIEK